MKSSIKRNGFVTETDHVCFPESGIVGIPDFCKVCGLFIPKSLSSGDKASETLRTPSYTYQPEFKTETIFQYSQLRAKEANSRLFNPNFLNHAERHEMVQIATEFCLVLHYSEKTLHTSIYYIDCILSDCCPVKNERKILAHSSVLLAAKLYESDHNIPFNNSLKKYLGPDFSLSDIIAFEILVCRGLDFKLSVKTPLDFFDFFLNFGVLSKKEVLEKLLFRDYQEVLEMLETKMKAFLEISRSYYQLNRFLPSIIAAACISLGRQTCGLNAWSWELSEMTEITWIELEPAVYEFNFLLQKDNNPLILRENILQPFQRKERKFKINYPRLKKNNKRKISKKYKEDVKENIENTNSARSF